MLPFRATLSSFYFHLNYQNLESHKSPVPGTAEGLTPLLKINSVNGRKFLRSSFKNTNNAQSCTDYKIEFGVAFHSQPRIYCKFAGHILMNVNIWKFTTICHPVTKTTLLDDV
jgi:hypothetical protein